MGYYYDLFSLAVIFQNQHSGNRAHIGFCFENDRDKSNLVLLYLFKNIEVEQKQINVCF